MQSKLLRVLESKEFERVGSSRIIPLQAGIIASTNKNLFLLSEEKKFRSDLYYRLNTIELFIPPLRRRSGDIPLLLDHFCDELETKLNLTQSALRLLTGYVWPGNAAASQSDPETGDLLREQADYRRRHRSGTAGLASAPTMKPSVSPKTMRPPFIRHRKH